jgi:hypothetical protein
MPCSKHNRQTCYNKQGQEVSEVSTAPATFSSISKGTEKAVRGMSGWIWSLGMTKAPTDTFGAPKGSLDRDSASTTL